MAAGVDRREGCELGRGGRVLVTVESQCANPRRPVLGEGRSLANSDGSPPIALERSERRRVRVAIGDPADWVFGLEGVVCGIRPLAAADEGRGTHGVPSTHLMHLYSFEAKAGDGTQREGKNSFAPSTRCGWCPFASSGDR